MEIKKVKIPDAVKEDYDEILFEILRELRRELASAGRVPPYIIFGDNTLKQMATYYPNTEEKMLDISGVRKK